MNNKAVGVSFCALAVVLFLARYFIAMLYRGFDPQEWGTEDFSRQVSYVSALPWFVAVVAFAVGIAYLAQKEK